MAPALPELFHNQDLTRHFLKKFMRKSSRINFNQIAKHTDSDSNLLMFRCKIFVPETENLFHNKLIILSKCFKLHNVIVRNIAWMTDTYIGFNYTLQNSFSPLAYCIVHTNLGRLDIKTKVQQLKNYQDQSQLRTVDLGLLGQKIERSRSEMLN